MAVSQCPKCKNSLVDYAWTKTKSNKNWLKHPQKGWHTCPNSTWKSNKPFKKQRDVQFYSNPFTYDPFNGNLEAKSRFDEKFRAVTVWCDECEDAYYLSYPCVHHLTDSARDKRRYLEWRSENRKNREVVEPEHKQKGL